jgi:hypothetical protein
MAAPDNKMQGAEGRQGVTRGSERSPTIDSAMIGPGSSNATVRAPLSRTLHIWLCLALGLAACHPRVDGRVAPASQPADSAQTSYLAPPKITAAVRMDNGGVALAGRTDPEARVRLQSPDGAAYGVTAGADGTWTLATPSEHAVRLLGVSEVVGSRVVQSMGYLAVLPVPGQAAILLRAGGGSQAMAPAPSAPWIAAIDFDAGGGAVICGLARPGVPVRVVVDGVVAGEARPDADGRFSVAPTLALNPGAHQAVAQSTLGEGHAAFVVSPAPALSTPSFVGQRQAAGWRIDWLTPGGAPQTTLAFDPPKAGS